MANFGRYFTCQNHHSAVRKNIPLRILNTFNHENKGTLITSNANEVGIKTLSVLESSLSKSRRKRIAR
jgi:aspartokinase